MLTSEQKRRKMKTTTEEKSKYLKKAVKKISIIIQEVYDETLTNTYGLY